jgi:O-antigen/teichoic acid export membrane protein
VIELLRRPSAGIRLNTMLTSTGTAVSLISSLVMRLVIARMFGPGPLGLYALALGYQRVTGQIADGGLHYALLRRASNDEELLRRGLSLKMLIGAAIAIIVALPSLAPTPSPDVRIAIILAAIGVFGWSQLDSAQLWLRSRSRFSADLALHASMSAFRVLVAIVVLIFAGNVPLALAAYFAVPVIATAIVPLPWLRPAVPLSMVRDSAASVIYRCLWLLWLNIDLLVIGWVMDISSVGRYDAPRSLAYPVLAIAEGAAVASLQHLGSGRGTLIDTAHSLVKPALLIVIATPLFAAAAHVALPLLFGPTFSSEDLVLVFTLLFVGFVAASAAMPYASALLFTWPKAVIALTAMDVALAAAAYAAVAGAGIVAVAVAASALQGVNLAGLMILTRRAH